MHLLILSTLLGCAFAGRISPIYSQPAPAFAASAPNYGFPTTIFGPPVRTFSSHVESYGSAGQFHGAPVQTYGTLSKPIYGDGFGETYQSSSGYGQGFGGHFSPCGPGEVLNVDGKCGKPILTQNFLVYSSPTNYVAEPPVAAPPRVDTNIVFVHAPKTPHPPKPIVVPDSEKRTAVFLISKNQQIEGQKVIEVPAGPQQSPEVFYVNYDEGENPILPGGISLQDALKSANFGEGKLLGGVNKGVELEVENDGYFDGGVDGNFGGNFGGDFDGGLGGNYGGGFENLGGSERVSDNYGGGFANNFDNEFVDNFGGKVGGNFRRNFVRGESSKRKGKGFAVLSGRRQHFSQY